MCRRAVDVLYQLLGVKCSEICEISALELSALVEAVCPRCAVYRGAARILEPGGAHGGLHKNIQHVKWHVKVICDYCV